MKEAVVVDSAASFLEVISSMRGHSATLPVFRGWPSFHVEIEGDRYRGTMTPKLMLGFVEFHEQLLRAYAEIRYGSPALTRLTVAEKTELDLVFQISKGCTDGKASLDEVINKLLAALPMSKMTGAQVATFLIVAVLSFAGYHVFSEWNANDLEKARLAASQAQGDVNARIAEKLADVIAGGSMTTEAARVRDRASEGYRAIVSAAPDADSMEIQGHHYNADELEHIRAQEPKDRVRSERREDLLVEMVKRNQDYLSLTLRLPGEEYTFPGRVELSTFDPEKIDRLFDAIKHNKPVRLFHFSVMENGRILRTAVLAVDDVTSSKK